MGKGGGRGNGRSREGDEARKREEDRLKRKVRRACERRKEFVKAEMDGGSEEYIVSAIIHYNVPPYHSLDSISGACITLSAINLIKMKHIHIIGLLVVWWRRSKGRVDVLAASLSATNKLENIVSIILL